MFLFSDYMLTQVSTTVLSIGDTVKRAGLSHLGKSIGFNVKHFSPKTIILVARSVLDSQYRNAVSLGIPIVQETFIHELSLQENSSSVIITDDMIERHKLPRFQGITVFFAGFHESDIEDKAFFVETYSGRVTRNISKATHIVVADGYRVGAVTASQYLTTQTWLSESVDLGWCANERNFTVPNIQPKLKRRDAAKLGKCESARKTLSDRRFIAKKSTDRSDSRKYKRYQQAWELYKNEINTLKIIDLLLRVKVDCCCISSEAAELIFGNFELLQSVHSRIVEKLGKVLSNWNDDSIIGLIFVEETPFIEKAYIPYLYGLETAHETLKECRTKNAKFKSFLEVKESSKMFEKNKIDYLLTAPYQELTSRISVLLKEILKNTEEHMADFSSLRQAVDRINCVLSKANECKKKNSENELIYKQIELLPAFIVSSTRSFIHSTHIHSLGGSGSWAHLNRCSLHLLLFDDVLIICRKSTRSASCVSLSTLRSSSSLKKYRFVCSTFIPDLRHILRVGFGGDTPVFIFTIRSAFGDEEWIIQEDDNTSGEFDKFVVLLSKQVERVVLDREMQIENVNFNDLEDERRITLRRMTSFGFSSTPMAENSPLGKFRSYSQRLRKRDIMSVKRSSTTSSIYRENLINTSSKSANDLRIYGNTQYIDDRTQSPSDMVRFDSSPVRTPKHHRDPVEISPNSATSSEATCYTPKVDPYEQVKYFSPIKNIRTPRLY